MKAVKTSAERTVALAIEETWQYVDDPERLGIWFGTGDRLELLVEGGVGRKMRFHTTWSGRPAHIEVRVTTYDPPHQMDWVHEREFLDGRPAPALSKRTVISIGLEEIDAGTNVKIAGSSEPAGQVSGLLFRLMGSRRARRSFESSLNRLETLLNG